MHPPVLDTWPLTQYTDYGPRPVESSPNHAGIDYGPKSGIRVKVYAPFDGYVSRIVRGRKHGDTSTVNSLRPGVTGNGPCITDDGDGKSGYMTALMGHVDVLDSLKVGDRVTEGQHIGWTDLSGNTSGHHVHFELHTGQSARSTTHYDPLPTMKAAGAEPGREYDVALDQSDLNNIEQIIQKYVPKPADMGATITQQTSIERTLVLLRRIESKLDDLPSGGTGTGLTADEVKALINATELTIK